MPTVFKYVLATQIVGTTTTLNITSVTSNSPSAGYTTFGFAAQTVAPYTVGTTIYINGLSVSGYNGGYSVTDASTASVSVVNALTTAIKGALNASTTYTSVSGTSVSAAATYSAVSAVSTSGSGTGATFNVTKIGAGTSYSGFITVTVVSVGTGYAVGDTVTVSGANLGGANGTNNLTFTISSSVTVLSGTVKNNLIYSNPSATTTIIGLSLTNTTPETVLATIQLQDTVTATSAYYISNIPVPGYQSLRVVTGGEKLILTPATNVFVTSNVAQSLDAVVSWVEIS